MRVVLMLMIGVARDVVFVVVVVGASIVVIAFPLANTTAIAKISEASRRSF